MFFAMRPLPVPVSPVRSTVVLVWATARTLSNTFSIPGVSVSKSSKASLFQGSAPDFDRCSVFSMGDRQSAKGAVRFFIETHSLLCKKDLLRKSL